MLFGRYCKIDEREGNSQFTINLDLGSLGLLFGSRYRSDNLVPVEARPCTDLNDSTRARAQVQRGRDQERATLVPIRPPTAHPKTISRPIESDGLFKHTNDACDCDVRLCPSAERVATTVARLRRLELPSQKKNWLVKAWLLSTPPSL